jgi:chorismate synthase
MTRLRWLTAGESHGPALTVIVEGVPAGLGLQASEVQHDLARRQKGYGRGGRMKIERDRATLDAGVRGGETLGSPISMRIDNADFASWTGRMGPEPFETKPEAVTLPRPGHADLAGGQKYDRHDLRDILERASARETAARVAAGAVARAILRSVGISVASRVISIERVADLSVIHPHEWAIGTDAHARIEASELRVLNPEVETRMKENILAASHAGDTVGGVVEAVALGVMPGLGSHVHWDRKLDGRLAQATLSIHAVKAVEIGDGWSAATLRGSEVHDAIGFDAEAHRYTRTSNRAGGLEGGITTGEPLVVRAAMKPISTLRKALTSVNVVTHDVAPATVERSDICAVPAMGVVLEAMVCLTLADALLEKFGGDSMRELLDHVARYQHHLRTY